MKRSTLFFIVLLIVNANFVISQNNINVEYGTLFKNEKRQIPIDIIGHDDNGYYLLYSEGKYGQGDDMFLRKFNLDLSPSGLEINLKNENYNGKFNSLGLRKIKNKIIHVFYLLTDLNKTYYYQNVDLPSFKLSEKKVIATIQHDSKNAKYAISRFLFNELENTITLFYTIPNKRQEIAKVKIQTFDFNFHEISNSYYELPFSNKEVSLRKLFLSNDGKLFVLYKKYDGSNLLNFEYQLYKVTSSQFKLITKIRPNDVHLRAVNTTITDNNQLILTGIYSKKDIYSMVGIYSSKINLETGNIEYSRYNKFSSNFFSQLMSEGKRKDKAILKFNQGKREDPNYVLKETIPLDNDELLILTEQIWSYTYNYATTFYHHNIAAIKLDKTGDIIWANKIGKRNDKSNVSIYSSYYPVLKKDNIHFLYNCSSENINHKKGKLNNYFTDTTNRAFITTNLNINTGEYKRQILIDTPFLNGITIRPLLYNWIDEDTLLMFGQDSENLKNQRFIKLKFD